MSRVYNFSSGPAALPLKVLERIREDIPDWNGSGMSVMEVNHRSKIFIDLAEKAEQDVRDLLSISNDYSVLFLQGGATLQFAMTPLNLSQSGDIVDYVQTGSWSKKAISEASRFCTVNIVADSSDSNFCHIPSQHEWQKTANAAYFHYTPNETIAGVEFHFIPETGEVPLVADMSSTILSRPIDVNRFGVIYAGAQKNIGLAGLTLVIVRNDLLARKRADAPTLLTYKAFVDSGSMANTPPTFAWYVTALVLEELKAQGGIVAMAKINESKAMKLYRAIDDSNFYNNPIQADCRSWMNVPFVLRDANLNTKFLAESELAGLVNLKGHRSVGGMRASIYNAMPEEGIDALIYFMQNFEKVNG
jgi:phosphoserine aminotransferase